MASGAFSLSRKNKNSSGVAGDCFCASFALLNVSFSLCLLFYTKACGCLKKMHLYDESPPFEFNKKHRPKDAKP